MILKIILILNTMTIYDYNNVEDVNVDDDDVGLNLLPLPEGDCVF